MDHTPQIYDNHQDQIAALHRRIRELEAQVASEQQAAEQLRQSEVRFASLFRANPGAVVISTLDEGRYLEVNQRFCELTGYLRDEVIGRTSFELGIWIYAEERAQVGRLLMSQPLIRDLELHFRAKDGSEHVALGSFARIELDGKLCVLTICQDITGRQLRAEERDRLYTAAQAALGAREEFLSVTAHELKTPITSLTGYTQLLLRRLQRNQQVNKASFQQALDAIEHQAAKLNQLVNQLLDVSRIDTGDLLIQRQLTDLRSLAERVASSLQLTSDRHRLVVSAPEIVPIAVDPLRLEQVLTNLVDNAIKYSPAGGTVQIAIGPLPDEHVQISVTDQGPGLSAEQRARIFERFYRVQRRDGRGIGLGLYISRQIVELHGGHLTVESPSSGGSRFVITLPGASAHLSDDGELHAVAREFHVV